MLLALQRNKALDLMNPHVLDYLDKPQALGNLVIPHQVLSMKLRHHKPQTNKTKKTTQFYNKKQPTKTLTNQWRINNKKKKKYKHVLVK